LHCQVFALLYQMPSTDFSDAPLARAWYSGSIASFVAEIPESVLGTLTKNSTVTVTPDQRDAWLDEVLHLQHALLDLDGSIFLEFNVPRMGRRVDAILLIDAVVFVVEFKAFARSFESNALEQVWDYALDLKNFHEASHRAAIVPILVATGVSESREIVLKPALDQVFQPVQIIPTDLKVCIGLAVNQVCGCALNASAWHLAAYRPTPTIIEAARALYSEHAVDALRCFDAGKENLAITVKRIEALVDEARETHGKFICFVTGVPGAGKTLVGLDIATDRRDLDSPTHAVYLSGNGPLVAVLRAALTRDEKERRQARGERVTNTDISQSVQAFIQNVHHFRDEYLRSASAPHDHVVIFDEAQRAWNREKTSDFMRRRRNRGSFDQSEPEFLISCMDRHEDWAVIVCLVGGGQEIHTGEAGIGGWIDAIEGKFPHWRMFVSSQLKDSEYAAGQALERVKQRPHTVFENGLHLAVSMRSFRAEKVSAFVKALLDREVEAAREMLALIIERYPVAITRDLSVAKKWIREQARGSERFGLVASSKALRLKPHAVDVRVDVDPIHWFLNGRDDVRSSYYLEDAATEFQVQGLELDWVCVTWDGDLRFVGGEWAFHDFRGSRWQRVKKLENQDYLRNAYRVLLTRARQGMVVFVPEGDPEDPTRPPDYYDGTFNYLAGLGMPVLR
jgi:hypothetical protein